MIEPGKVETTLIKQTGKSTICAALIDPEDFSPKEAAKVVEKAIGAGVKVILVGGSTLANQAKLDSVLRAITSVTSRVTRSQSTSRVPVVLFPGNVSGVSRYADAILFSSLLNSTNTYFIVGAQALGSMEVLKSGIESIPMGYLVFGSSSATSFIGQVNTLPASKPQLAVIYALAAKYMGMRSLYLEAGSGSDEPIQAETIRAVRKFYEGLLIVGGGITSAEAARKAARAGADIVVVGNLLQTRGFEGTLAKIVAAASK
ncbi:MAG: geranylgeranylglyceryl/heptaprenylglyceryl phosphate synthase [archaeon]|nr:MAG: geranylgeranylglyceryl/heptaprenylglyceryl phosphate synthase [archaeon]